jgi:ammonium transporter, Amt family
MLSFSLFAEEQAQAQEMMDKTAAYAIDNFFCFLLLLFLVIFMQAGFAMLEAGLNAPKNTVNILFKNLMDFSIGGLLFFLFGYGLMYPGEAFEGGYFGFGGFFIPEATGDIGPGVLHPQVDFLFQVAFAATAATIVSGAVAGRLKFSVYIILYCFYNRYCLSYFWILEVGRWLVG